MSVRNRGSADQPLLTKERIMAAVADIDSLSIEISEESGLLVWDNEDAKMLPFHFPEAMTPQSLAERIFVSSDIPSTYRINKDALAEYLWETCDRNAFITLDELVVIWSEPCDEDTFDPAEFTDSGSEHLYEKFGDEYAYEIGQDVLGQLWWERNVAVINMGEIVRASENIARENEDLAGIDPYFSVEHQVLVGLLTTSIHELRHLQMDTNILLPEDVYPLILNSEEAVENYCREAFDNSNIRTDIVPGLFQPCEKVLHIDVAGHELSSGQVEFFKDSKIRNGDGVLLVCYHATSAEFNVFDKAKIGTGNGGMNFGKGFYFTPSRSIAEDYGENVGEFYLNIKNPFHYYSTNKSYIVDMLDKSGYSYDKNFVDSYNEGALWDDDLIDDFLSLALPGMDPYAEFSKMVQNAGFDGVWADNEIVVFEPEKIKHISEKNLLMSRLAKEASIMATHEKKSPSLDERINDTSPRVLDNNSGAKAEGKYER